MSFSPWAAINGCQSRASRVVVVFTRVAENASPHHAGKLARRAGPNVY